MKIFRTLTLILFSVPAVHCAAQQSKQIPRDTSYNIAKVYSQIKKDYPYVIPVKDSLPTGLKGFRNLVYATLPNTPFGRRDLHLDVFRPKNERQLPALVLVHGGGWRSGDKSMEVPLAQLIAKSGFVTIPVEYQLSLEAQYPAAVYNIKSAIRWIKANAKTYGIDTTKIAISGTSAGGQLASLVGTTNGLPQFEGNQGVTKSSSTVQAIIDIDGVINFMAPASLNLDRKPDSPDIAWLGGSYLQRPDIWKAASAGYWANEKTVPILFLNSGFSRFHAGQDELIGSLKEWGIYHEVHQFNVKVHPFWLFHPWADESAGYIADFMKKIFKTY
ncbi:alpha/beta hydrolase [Pedobacter rhizosphaerae]|uniref:Acetyl esterase/lipase n=1 Tax=Pedobacter rhizosphaerae TaxID=390241 RepID=A0A1H9PQH8_9SPHI|nr:alpha/beta hydrolase [Pedobacter rhizosphaerae]SER50340.1 Acetyl esterase/lipase [Pedobacter rhizosphaerae]